VSDINALVVFYSRYGTTERLALATGVGAIEARANIRLRRLADLADGQTIDADARWKDELGRMNRDYVAPRPADVSWADIIVLAAPADMSDEVVAYCRLLPSLGSMTGKIAIPMTPGQGESILAPLYSAAASAGLLVVPAPSGAGEQTSAAREHGRLAVGIARALKAMRL
jgi:NAD(P)H dehydrogenase (quinone)